ncbi:MAG TPA: hypothetical protein VGO93_04170 [Candidatus Xenobia bacterium]|jgi:hypothetical protein
MSELPKEILEGAVLDSEGEFTVAVDKARDKLARFQLPDPRGYILQIVQAIVASGATFIEATVSGAWTGDLPEGGGIAPGYRLLLCFDGPGYAKEELNELFDHVFESQRRRDRDRLREMALGLLSSQALDPVLVRLACGGFQWIRHNREEGAVRPVSPGAQHVFELRRLGTSTEAELLRENCQALPIRLEINGDLVNLSKQLASATPWPAWTFKTDAMHGCIGLPYAALDRTRLHFYRYGVRLAARVEESIQPPVVIMFDHSGLLKNVSQSDIVEDGAWHECLGELQKQIVDFANHLCSRHVPPYHGASVYTFLMSLLAEWIPPPLLLAADEDVAPELLPFLTMKLFRDRQGRMRSLREISTYFRRDGFVGTISKPLRYAQLPDWLILQPSELEERALRQLFEKVLNMDKLVPAIVSPNQRLEADMSAMEKPPDWIYKTEVVAYDRRFKVGAENAWPTGACSVYVRDGKSKRRAFRLHLNGWSLRIETQCLEMEEPHQAVKRALQVLEQQASSVYQKVFECLSDASVQARAREHLAAWWSSCLLRMEGIPIQSRAMWGEREWFTPWLTTRAGAGVTMADLEAWRAASHPIVVSYGGGRQPGDHALEASPSTARLLRQVFGSGALIHATLHAPCWTERQAQSQLPGFSIRPREPDVPPFEYVDLGEPVEEPVVSPRPRPVPTPIVLPDDLLLDEEPPAAEAAPEPTVEPEPAEPAAVESVAAEPPPMVVPEPRPVVFVRYTLEHALMKGQLELSTCSQDVEIRVPDGPPERLQLLGVPVGGWIESAQHTAAWGAPEWQVVRAAVTAIFERLAGVMRDGPRDPDFPRMRDLMLAFLVAFKDALADRLQRQTMHDPLLRVKFLPLMGGGLANLLMLASEARASGGALPVMPEGADPPCVPYPPAAVGETVPRSFYETIFGSTVEVSEADLSASPSERLMVVLRRELLAATRDAGVVIAEADLASMTWASGLGSALCQVETGILLNADHKVWREAARRLDRDPALVPLLVSMLFSSLRRAWDQGDEAAELRVLTALLRRARPEK